MKKLKLMTIVGTRPELIRLSETIKKADKYFNHIFVHTGQNYDPNLNDIFYDDLGIRKPDFYLGAVTGDLGETIGHIIAKSYAVMRDNMPDSLLILGDTNSTLSAVSAKRLKIPIFHMEAGNRCFDENLPEEMNRRIVDHIADVNLPYTEHARRYLLSEGICKERVFVIGSPMAEVIYANNDKIEQSNILERLNLRRRDYFVLSAHREENIDNEKTFRSLMSAVNALAEHSKKRIIYSVHPRSAKFIKERNFKFHELVLQMPPFNFSEYGKLISNAYCVISDSGTIPEEAAVSKFPAVCIRTSTERPEALDKGVFILGGIGEVEMFQAIQLAVEMFADEEKFESVPDYDSLNISGKVIRLIQSYTHVVNRGVWRKYDA